MKEHVVLHTAYHYDYTFVHYNHCINKSTPNMHYYYPVDISRTLFSYSCAVQYHTREDIALIMVINILLHLLACISQLLHANLCNKV